MEPYAGLYKPTLRDVGAAVFYEKVLTSSDLNADGRVYIPKAKALEHFPQALKGPYDLECKDTLGNEHNISVVTFVNNKTRIFALEGTRQLQEAYQLKIGHVLQIGTLPSGEYVVCGRQYQEGYKTAPSKLVVTLDRTKRKLATPSLAESQSQSQSHRQTRSKAVIPNSERRTQVVKFRLLADGIFREVSSSGNRSGIRYYSGAWSAAVSLQGQVLEAFFPTHEEAEQAYLALGIET